MTDNVFYSFIFGIISALALPIGAGLSGLWSPRPRVIAFLMAFGSGALLAVVSVDLVSEAVRRREFLPLTVGCISGGILFVVFNQLVNNWGGFLRKFSTTVHHLKRKKIQNFKKIFFKLSNTELFSRLPPEEIEALIPHISSRAFEKGTVIIKQGDIGDSIFIIEEGEVDIVDEKNPSQKIATLKNGGVLGEMALVTGESRSFTAVATENTLTWIIFKKDFDKVLHTSPKLAEAVKAIVKNRIADLQQKKTIESQRAEEWVGKAIKNIDTKIALPTDVEIKEAAKPHLENPLGIWLGALLDGVPESLLVGACLLETKINVALIFGIFISNFPEALSSACGMRQQNFSFKKIFWMWTAIMILSGICALLGNILLGAASHSIYVLFEGFGAGAMLTMIAETMLPEAYYKGGTITGISTLLGFLATILIKTFE